MSALADIATNVAAAVGGGLVTWLIGRKLKRGPKVERLPEPGAGPVPPARKLPPAYWSDGEVRDHAAGGCADCEYELARRGLLAKSERERK